MYLHEPDFTGHKSGPDSHEVSTSYSFFTLYMTKPNLLIEKLEAN